MPAATATGQHIAMIYSLSGVELFQNPRSPVAAHLQKKLLSVKQGNRRIQASALRGLQQIPHSAAVATRTRMTPCHNGHKRSIVKSRRKSF